MQLSIIAPQTASAVLCGTDTIHLTLTHWAAQDPHYLAYFKHRVDTGAAYVILDNGAHEHKFSDPVDQLIECAKAMDADEIVLPDVIADGPATVKSSLAALPKLRKELHGKQIMAVPQGRDFVEWLECLEQLSQLDVDVIGIPRIQADVVGSWLPHVLAVESMMPGVPIHLLGSPHDLSSAAMVEQAFPNRVRSTDTSKPVHYAMVGLPIHFPLNPHQRNHISRPSNFLQALLTSAQITLANYNIAVLKAAIGDETWKKPNQAYAKTVAYQSVMHQSYPFLGGNVDLVA